MKKNNVFAIALLALATSAASADDGGYVGAAYFSLKYKEEGVPTANLGAVGVKLGRTLSKHVAVEARIGKGVQDDTVEVPGVPIPVEVELKNFYGFYLRATAPVAPRLLAYGLVGFTQAKLSASADGFTKSETDGDVSYGVGADYMVDKNVFINGEAARYFSGDGYTVNGFSIGVSYYY